MDVSKKRKRSKSQHTHVKICNVCGSKGFLNALVYCSQCSDTMVHQYCVGISPGNFDDSSNWVCECCRVVTEPESCTCHVSASASNERNPECCIVHVEALAKKITCKENPEHEETRSCSQIAEEVLNTTSISLDYREENETSISSFMEYPETPIYGMVLVVSPSGKIIIPRSSDICDEINSQYAGDIAICRFLTYGEELEAQFSSFMEYPEEIGGELVLLVKPAGEIFIEYGSSFHNDSHLHNMVSKGNLGYKETRSCYQIDEEVLSTAPISVDFSLYDRKEYERPDSSFMVNPESLICGLVLVASASGKLIIYKSSDMRGKFNSPKAEDGATCFLTYGDELETQASSFMEYPKEISRELVLLVKPTGEIICSEIKADSFVGTLVPRPVTPDSLPVEVIDRCGDFGYDCRMEDVEPICVLCKETDVWSSYASDGYSKTDMQGGVVFESMFNASDSMEGIIQQSDEDLEAEGSKWKHGMGDKKTTPSSFLIYGYIPPIRPECKRPRSKRYKTSSLPTKEIDDICRVTDLPGTVSGYKQGTKRRKTMVIQSLALCGHVPPLQPGCRRVRSKRWKEKRTETEGELAILNRDEEHSRLADGVDDASVRNTGERVCIVNG
ncbi:hypothetical protein KSS87_006113 [Heliosperma pusillum]|nr:hypothetical protein KSS87_006113 [Heliosperma pusillum]